jgi:hypothetical protein
MAALTFSDIGEVGSKGRTGGSYLVQVTDGGVNANAVVYSGMLTEARISPMGCPGSVLALPARRRVAPRCAVSLRFFQSATGPDPRRGRSRRC